MTAAETLAKRGVKVTLIDRQEELGGTVNLAKLPPLKESIDLRLARAEGVSDRSVRSYRSVEEERGHYRRLYMENVTQELVMDSLKVNYNRYPYEGVFYGRMFHTRQSNIQGLLFESRFTVREVPRSKENAYGYMIENFNAKVRPLDIRKR